MAGKSIIHVKCPCCHRVLEIDVDRERVLAHREGPHLIRDRREGEDTLDVARRVAEERKKAAEDRFSRARDDVKHAADRLDELFRSARERANREDGEGSGDAAPSGPPKDRR